MADVLARFNPHVLREPITPREKQVAAAAALAGVECYNFFETEGSVQFNMRWWRDGEEWVYANELDNRTIDTLSTVALSEIIAVDPDTVSAVAK